MDYPQDFKDFSIAQLEAYAAMVQKEFDEGELHGPLGRAIVRDAHQRVSNRKEEDRQRQANWDGMPPLVVIDSFSSVIYGNWKYTILAYADAVHVFVTDPISGVGQLLFIQKRETWENDKLYHPADLIAAISNMFERSARIDESLED